MKFAAVALAAATLAANAAAAAPERASDVDFLRANRCKGLATTITGVVDPASLDSYIKAQSGSRAPYIATRAADEADKARREARSAERRDRLTAELSGPCQALLSGGAPAAKQSFLPN